MKISKLISILDEHVPFSTAESWDNVGLLIGDANQEVSGILTALDCTKEVVNQAIERQVNTIIAHHPLIFKGINNIVENDGYGLIIRKLIQHNINLIAMHTNLDVHPNGVNKMLADAIELQHIEIFNRQSMPYFKVQTFIPKENVEPFKDKLNELGLAKEGDYEYCFFESSGKGQFKPIGNANPYLGTLDSIEYVNEIKLEFMINEHQRYITEQAILNHHPYETPVYDFIKMQKTTDFGLGIIGELKDAMTLDEFSNYVKDKLKIASLKYTGNPNAVIKNVSIIGGSGIGFEYEAKRMGADIFVTGDIKHHEALDAKIQGVNLLDINHYSEYVMKKGLKQLLENWLFKYEENISISVSDTNTDPFTYK